jgi:ribonuclease HII
MTAFKTPTFSEERRLVAQGINLIAGVDEVGCGCWAGPVFAAAVILPLDSRIGLIRDSKTLSPAQRQRLAEEIKSAAVAWAIGAASAEEIDALNIRKADALAMLRAVEGLGVKPQFVLIDAFRIPGLAIPSKSIIHGDAEVKSIAAASILAKVARDSHMEELARLFPGYGFEVHKGYGTKVHQEALCRLGPCPEHRRTYEPVRKALIVHRIT